MHYHQPQPFDPLRVEPSSFRPANVQVSLPYQVKRILNIFSFTVNFGLEGVGTPLECLGLRGYFYKLLAFMIAPISLALLIGSLAVGARVNMRLLSCRTIFEAALPSFLKIMFFACARASRMLPTNAPLP